MMKARNSQFDAIPVTPNECGGEGSYRCDGQGDGILSCNDTS